MDREGLIYYRTHICEIGEIKTFATELRNIFGENFEFPLIIGSDKELDRLEIRTISPLQNSDKLTIENFLEGVKELGYGMGNSYKFKGEILLGGIESNHKNNLNENLLQTSIQMGDSSKYELNLYLCLLEDKLRYTTISNRIETRPDEIMNRFMGPNQKYGQWLL